MLSILLRSFAAAVVGFALTHVLIDEAMSRDAELARRLQANGEAVTATVSGHESRSGSCNMTLTGTTAAGGEFVARDSQANGCGAAPAIGSPQDIVVWREDPTQFMHAEWLAQRDESGRTPTEARDRWLAPMYVAGFLALVAALIAYVARRRGRQPGV